ncbi:MAG: putative sigma-54 modulation protein [Pseudohongiellaceae bacterium]|jgi:putative sigma-54 modulation protein
MTVRIDLTDRHHTHSAEEREHVKEKVSKLTHYFDRVNHIEIILDKEHDQHVVEVLVTADNHMHFVGHAMNDSMPTAVDKVVSRLERQVVKAKERLKDHKRGDVSGKTL